MLSSHPASRGPHSRSFRGACARLLALLLTGACASAAQAPIAPTRTLELATWNLEWLIAPREFRALKERCAPDGTPVRGSERRLPCDVAFGHERAASDFDALARYARRLDADVVALQEVDGPEAARLVFEDHEFCFTSRRHLQNTGFAIRRGIPYRCGPDVSLSKGDALRRAAQLVLFPGQPHEMRLLSVHLKAGCTRDPLDSGREACRDLARQVPLLEQWIDAQARAGRRFAVLGDFNRDVLRERGPARSPQGRLVRLWPEIDDADPPGADLVNVAAGERFVNCAPGQRYRSYIDLIVLGRELAADIVPGSFERLTYEAADAHRRRLADHCPVAIRVRVAGAAKGSAAE